MRRCDNSAGSDLPSSMVYEETNEAKVEHTKTHQKASAERFRM